MHTENSDINLSSLSFNELLEKKKKINANFVNLECKKEQLSVLIEKLSSLSSERGDLLSAEQGQSIFSKLFSMGDQLKQAEKNKNKLENEILQAKKQMDSIISLLNKKQG